MNLPIYRHLFNQLKDKILRGELKPGDMLQSENELAQQYSTSRLTVRKSLSMLDNEGFITSFPGKGYYIIEPDHSKYTLLFNELNSGSKYNLYSKLLGVDATNPDEAICRKLQISCDHKVVVILRLLHSNEGPVAYDIKYIPYDRGRPIVEKAIEYAALPDMVAKKSSPFAIKKELCIYIEKSNPEINKSLCLHESEPLLVVEQRLYDYEDKPIGLGKTYYGSEHGKIRAYSNMREYEKN